jgi:transcriptional regulator with XRE-family HTH domain
VPAQRLPEHKTQLGQALRHAREDADGLQKDVAELLGISQSSITRMEQGAKSPTQEQLNKLLEHYDPTPQLRERITRLALVDKQDSPALNVKFDRMLSASEAATAIHTFHSERIPMTLQCDRYALKQYSAHDPSIDPDTVLWLHDRRRKIFDRSRPPAYDAVMTVSSLLRMPAGQMDLVQEQAQHLLGMLADTPRFTLRVLHLEAAIAYIRTDFTLLKMANRKDDMVYSPSGMDGQTIRGRASTKEWENYWHEANRAALSEEESRDFLRLLAEQGYGAAAWPSLARRTN